MGLDTPCGRKNILADIQYLVTKLQKLRQITASEPGVICFIKIFMAYVQNGKFESRNPCATWGSHEEAGRVVR
jgi:hypothetical protein